MHNKSPIDEFFFELYGFYPQKAGTAYEMIVGAALKVATGKNFLLNRFFKGIYSKTPYQIDAILDNKIMVEAKDHTLACKPVRRGEIQTMQGALTDLEFDSGIFASATGFTEPAESYADSSSVTQCKRKLTFIIYGLLQRMMKKAEYFKLILILFRLNLNI